ncbi:MAG: hypothetical protein ACP5CD_01220 [Thermovirgaceae bacterium]
MLRKETEVDLVEEMVVPEYRKKEKDFDENLGFPLALEEMARLAFGFREGLCGPAELCEGYSVSYGTGRPDK